MKSITDRIRARFDQVLGGKDVGTLPAVAKESEAPTLKAVKSIAKPKRRLKIVSHPKCGRTWLAVMLSKALNMIYALNMENEFSVSAITKKIVEEKDEDVAITAFHHDSSCFRRAHRFSYLRHDDKKEFAGQDVILLVRDPRDVLVSSFHQIIDRDKNAHSIEPDISRFLRDEVYGIRKLLAFYQSWERNRQVPESFTLIRYEDMHRDPADALRAVLRVMNVKNIDENAVQVAVNASTFKEMQMIEREGTYKAGALSFVGEGNVNAMKVRKGKIRGYREELSADDVEFLDQFVRDNGCPFYDPAELFAEQG